MGMEVAASAARCGEMRGREKVRERCPLGDLALQDLLVFIYRGVGLGRTRSVLTGCGVRRRGRLKYGLRF